MTTTATKPTKPVPGSPTSTQPIAGLSARGQKLIKPRPYGSHYCTPIEPAGAGLERHSRTKARI